MTTKLEYIIRQGNADALVKDLRKIEYMQSNCADLVPDYTVVRGYMFTEVMSRYGLEEHELRENWLTFQAELMKERGYK